MEFINRIFISQSETLMKIVRYENARLTNKEQNKEQNPSKNATGILQLRRMKNLPDSSIFIFMFNIIVWNHV